MPNFPRQHFTALRDRLRTTTALKGIAEVLLGARDQPKNTQPWRIVLYPTGAPYVAGSDKSITVTDARQGLRAECWAKGQTNDPGSDYDACWYLVQRLLQAMEEQAQNFDGNGSAGYWYDAERCEWNTDTDTSAQGVALAVLLTVQLPVVSAAGDEGHVGDAWEYGVAETTIFEVNE